MAAEARIDTIPLTIEDSDRVDAEDNRNATRNGLARANQMIRLSCPGIDLRRLRQVSGGGVSSLQFGETARSELEELRPL